MKQCVAVAFCLSGPPCGPICSNERVESVLQEVKPQIQTLKEKLNTVSQSVTLLINVWVQFRQRKLIYLQFYSEPHMESKTGAHMPVWTVLMCLHLFYCKWLRLTSLKTRKSLNSYFTLDMKKCIFFYSSGRCQCGCSSKFLELKMVTTLEWLCRFVTADTLMMQYIHGTVMSPDVMHLSNRRKCLSCWPTHAPRSRDSKLRFQSKSLHQFSYFILVLFYLNNKEKM